MTHPINTDSTRVIDPNISKWAEQWNAIWEGPENENDEIKAKCAKLQQLRMDALTESLQNHDTNLLRWAWCPAEMTLHSIRPLKTLLTAIAHTENPDAFRMVNDLLRSEFPADDEEPSLAGPFFESLAKPHKKYAAYEAPQDRPLNEVDKVRAACRARYDFLMDLAHPSNS